MWCRFNKWSGDMWKCSTYLISIVLEKLTLLCAFFSLWVATYNRNKNTCLFCECRKHIKYFNIIATCFVSEPLHVACLVRGDFLWPHSWEKGNGNKPCEFSVYMLNRQIQSTVPSFFIFSVKLSSRWKLSLLRRSGI